MDRYSPRLPLELQETIIDMASTETLMACSLTCRMWSARSRKCLFEVVSLNSENADRFINLLLSSPSTALLVRHLLLKEIDWSDLRYKAREIILNGFHLVVELDIAFCMFDTLKEVTQLIASFPSLKRLHYERSSILIGPTFVDSTYPSVSKNLRVLEIYSRSCLSVIDWLIASHSLPTIETVEFTSHGLGIVMNEFHKLLRKLGSSLKSLKFTIIPGMSPTCFDDFNLLQNTALETLSLQTESCPKWIPDLLAAWIPQFLAQVTLPQLANLRIVLTENAMKDMDWTLVETIVCQPMRLPRLRVVHIEIEDVFEDYVSSCSNFLEAALPVLTERGFLVVSSNQVSE